MTDYKPSPKQEDRLLKLLMVFLIVFVVLIIINYYFGKSVLKKSQEYIKALRQVIAENNQVLAEPISKVTDPRLGQLTADNLIYMFGDFNCQYCGSTFSSIMNLRDKYPQKVMLVWKDAVNPDDDQGLKSSVAARCAQIQGQFWPYAKGLFAATELNQDLYLNLATSLNLNLTSFNQCLRDQETLNLVQEGYVEAKALQIDATPYLFINGMRASGEVSLDQLERVIN